MFTKDQMRQIAEDLRFASKQYDKAMLDVWSNVAAYEGMEKATVHPRVGELEQRSKDAAHAASLFETLSAA